jgi:predicted transcriptional regulator
MPSTTLKVSTVTRDRVKALSDAEHRTADQVINMALDYLERENRRRRMREQSLAALNDPVDRAEATAVQADLDDLRAW